MRKHRKQLVLCALTVLIALVLPAVPARAVICDIEVEPAATLLLPYFEVDLKNPNGVTTLIAVNNAVAAAHLVHVVLWSDLAAPVLDFNVYLTGFDQQTFNLRDLIVNGMLPQTASAGQDPNDTISPKGIFSQDINFASCNGVLPPPPLPPFFISYLADALTGHPSTLLHGRCVARNLGDHIARGYVTMDVVNDCTLRFPGDAGYFGAGGTGDASNDNALFGDYVYVNSAKRTAQALPLVHIQASSTDPRVTTPGNYTFYGSWDNFDASDNREPLPTTFGARYVIGGANHAATDYIAWRDPKVAQGPFTCPATPDVQPPWYPLGQESVVIFDDQEHPVVPQTSITSPAVAGITPFPAAAQRTTVGGPALPVPFIAGWSYLNLNTMVVPAGNVPPVDPLAAQAWVTIILSQDRGFATGIEAMHYDSACNPNHHDPND
jgi:hypothetical protein